MYDKNGNLKNLTRRGATGSFIDQITYGYKGNSNRLDYADDASKDIASVEDFPGTLTGTNHFQYDLNGNMTRDDYRSLSLQYNSFNLPWEMDFGNNKKVTYFYDGSGKKLTKIVATGTGAPVCTEYLGQFVHQYTMGGVSSLKYIITPEGRLKNKGTNATPVWEWEYNLTDHLGNVRSVIRPGTGNLAEIMEYTNYFPFGMKMTPGLSQSSTDNKYLYNGKEQQSDFGLNWYDYGARMYDAAIGRWHSVDPMAESGNEFSPYTYCSNNPVLMIDPTGMFSESSTYISSTIVDPNGKVIEHRDDGDPRVYLVNNVQEWRNNGSKKEDAEQVGYEYPGVDYAGMVGRPAIYYPSKAPFMPGFLNDGPIEVDYTLESIFIPYFGWLKAVKFSKFLGKYVFTITAKEGNLMFFSTKVGDKVIEFGGDITKTKGVIIIKNFDIDGDLTNKLGIRALKEIINDFGKQQGVNKVIIEGAKRTTGANPGRIPSQLIFDIK